MAPVLSRILGLVIFHREQHVITFVCKSVSGSTRQELDRLCAAHKVDYAILPSNSPFCHYRLLALDMDSTLITMESIDEIAAIAGTGSDVSLLTDAAIHGRESSYAQSMRSRMSMLRGVRRADILEMIRRKLVLTLGAVELVSAAKAAGLRTIVVSGGFQIVADVVQRLLAIDEAVAHDLEFENGVLTGRLPVNVIDAAGKAEILKAYCLRHGISSEQVIAVGDGANDIGMATFAGVFAGFRPKPALRSFCSVVLDHHGLDGLLLAVGTSQ